MKKILVVAVHPDDETLMCGGTLLKHKKAGDKIYWLIVTNISEKYGFKNDVVEKRQKEISEVAKLYEFEKTFKLDFPTTKLDKIPIGEIISSISKVINEVQPHTIYMSNRTDVHTDHQIAFDAAFSCTKNFRYPFIKRILMGETISETEFAPALREKAFVPNIYVDITDFFEQKIEILKIFESEIMPNYLPRSIFTITALSNWRGSSIGKQNAESFVLLKEIL